MTINITKPLNINSFRSARHFAKFMLADNRLLLRPFSDQIDQYEDSALSLILFREACWQVELIIGLPSQPVPLHRHNRVDSCDVGIGGAGSIVIGNRPKTIAASKQRGCLAANLIHVPKGVWHGGGAEQRGAAFLSFQRWDGTPGPIKEDWESWSPDSK